MSATERGSDVSSTPTTLRTQTKSPTVTVGFSDADTLITRDSHYSANTGGRARQSWRNSVSNIPSIFRRPSQISREQSASAILSDFSSSRKQSAGTTNSSPADPAFIPHPAIPIIPRSATPIVELPASPVTHPDELQSFFDSDTDSESGHDPIVSRASSVRVQKPQVVQNRPTSYGQSPLIYEQSPTASSNPGPSISKVQQLLGEDVTDLMLGSIAEPSDSVHMIESSKEASEQSNPITSGEQSDSTMRVVEASGNGMDTFLSLTPTDTDDVSPTRRTVEPFMDDIVMETPDPVGHSTVDTLPTPLARLSTSRHPRLNGLSINPVSSTDLETSHPHRAISAPLLPHRNPNRKVTIHPSDLVITSADGEHRVFRESVVSTPYPYLPDGVASQDSKWPKAATKEIDNNTADITSPHTQATPLSDRFPSPPRAELLTLTILLPPSQSSKTKPKSLQIEIPVPNEVKPTFDDEALFHILRASYNKSLGFFHRYIFTARVLVQASCPTDTTFDGADFVQLLKNPSEGRKRKTRVVWLRRRQQRQDERMPFNDAHTNMTSPRITLYYEFSATRIAIAVLAVLLLSCLVSILWVGVGYRKHAMAEGRVLTSLVLGIFVCMLGSLGVGVWIGGSWISR